MARWRDIKHKRNLDNNLDKQSQEFEFKFAPNIIKVKAFLTDMFMLMMPISYFTTYFILDGKNDFQSNDLAKWGVSIAFGIVNMIFWYKSGQTPGYKAYDIKVIDNHSHKNISFIQGTIRYLIFIMSYALLFGMIVPIFRKDSKSLHDLLSDSSVVMISE